MTKDQTNSYKEMLKAVGSLSRLSSESDVPYLGYRSVENMFCIAFDADNLSRSDCSVDASKDDIGVGIKTFRNANGRSLQKIAEFNRDSESYIKESPKEKIEIISRLRNERLESTKRIHGLTSLIYHCVVRDEGRIKVFECPMDKIDINRIKGITKSSKNVITFEDGINEYSFNISKSTLYKRFVTDDFPLDLDIKVDILEDPYLAITDILSNSKMGYKEPKVSAKHVFLPLFSDRGERHVPERSGLNQWNGKGRDRNPNEIYIPIPRWIHNVFPDFFPKRDKSFDLLLPDGSIINSKVCQDGGKALMSNPNSALGDWLLRTVMDLEERELLEYERLEELGIDSVVIYKESDDTYAVNFREIGSYDIFHEENKNNM